MCFIRFLQQYVCCNDEMTHYHSITNTQVDGPFSIGRTSGIIRLTARLDYSVRQQYNLRLLAEVMHFVIA